MPATVTSSAHSSTVGAATSLTFSATAAAGDRLVVLAFALGTVSLTSVTFNGIGGLRGGQIQFSDYKVEAWYFDAPSVTTANVVVTSPSSLRLGAGAFSVATATSLVGGGLSISFNRPLSPSTTAQGRVNTSYPPALGIAMIVTDILSVTIAKDNAADTALFTDTLVATTDLHLAAVSGSVTGPGNIFAGGWEPSWTLGTADNWAFVGVSIASGSGPVTVPPQVLFGQAVLASASATVYNSFPRADDTFSTNSTALRTPALAAGTLRNFSIRLRTAPGGAASRVFTIQKNGSDTLLVLTFGSGDTVQSDITNAVTIVSGDDLQIKQVPSGTPAAADAIEWTCDFEPTTPGHCLHGGYANIASTSAVCFNALLAPINVAGWETGTPKQFCDAIGVPGTIEAYGLQNPSFSSGVTYEFFLVKNGVVQDGTGGTIDTLITIVGDGASQQRTTKVVNLPCAVEDVISIQGERTAGGSVAINPTIFCRFAATTPGTFNISAHSEALGNNEFSAVSGSQSGTGELNSATEADVQVRIGVSGLIVDGLTVARDIAPGTGDTVEYRVRKNAADASLSVVIISGAIDTVGSAGGTPASYTAGDFINMGSIHTAGTPAVSALSYTLAGRVGTAGPNLASITQLGALVGYDEDAETDTPPTVTACSGGGVVVSGTNPAAGTSLATATIPLAWVEITPIGGTMKSYAGVGIPHGTMKEGRAQSLGTVKRQLCDADHGYEASVITSSLIDTDGALRALGSTLKGALVDYWIADLTTLKAGLTNMRRQFRGILDEWEAQSDRMFSITSVDALTARLTSIDADDLQTPVVLVDSSISDQNPLERMFDKPVPEPYGAISDEADANPEGVWEAKHLGYLTITGDEDLGNVALFLGSIGPVKNNQSLFGADVLSGDPPTMRIKLGASAFGDWRTDPAAYILMPGKTGWIESFKYLVLGSRRYNIFLARDGHPAVQQAVEGRIPFVMNFCAREATGDATGTLIDSGPHAIAHWLNASVLQTVGNANWPAQASFGDYSILDTATFAAVHTITNALSYKFAGVVGWDFQQHSWRDNLADMCRSVGAEFYTNRHGQGCLSKLDVSATGSGATAFTTQQILEGSVSVDQKLDAVENTERYVYKRAYKGALPDLTPVEGSRLYRDPYDGEWGSGLQTDEDSTSITALGGDPKGVRRSRVQEYYFVRDSATADALAAERLALRSPAGGRAEVTFNVSLKYSCDVELGDLVTVTHWDCPWTGSRRCRVLAKDTDLDQMEERLTVQDVDDLLA
jgi:hypothetical protein